MFSEEEMLVRLKDASSGATKTTKDFLDILRSSGFTDKKREVYIELLTSFTWHTIRKMIPRERFGELLSDTVINGLFPRQLKIDYLYARNMM